jgi:hypothetical protein
MTSGYVLSLSGNQHMAIERKQWMITVIPRVRVSVCPGYLDIRLFRGKTLSGLCSHPVIIWEWDEGVPI